MNTTAKTMVLVLCVLAVALVMQGCITTKSYVDPAFPKVGLSEVKSLEGAAQPLVLDFQFLRNGTAMPKITQAVRPNVETILADTGYFAPILTSKEASEQQLTIKLDNVGDIKEAKNKGFATGLTFGLAGNTVTDGYIFSASFLKTGKNPFEKTYNHAIVSTVGNAKGPEGQTPLKTTEAFDVVLQELLLNLVNDLKIQGYL